MPAFQDYGILYDGSKFFPKKVALNFGGFNSYPYLCKRNKTKNIRGNGKKDKTNR